MFLHLQIPSSSSIWRRQSLTDLLLKGLNYTAYVEYLVCAMCLVMSDSVIPWAIAHQVPLSMGILQARILEWVAMSSSRGSSQPRDQTLVSYTYLHWQVGSLPLAPPEKSSGNPWQWLKYIDNLWIVGLAKALTAWKANLYGEWMPIPMMTNHWSFQDASETT